MSIGRIIATLAITGTLASTGGCSFDSEESDGVSRRDCERLRDHLIDVRLQTVTADRDQHRIALRASLDDTFITSCVEATTPDHMRCALAAKNGEALGACTEPAAPPDPNFAGDPTAR